ncbi:MAG: hypothetical protein WC816_09695 [Sphingomonas sp.]|jgi:hypothetical protein
MKMKAVLLLALGGVLFSVGTADAQRRGEPQRVFDAARAGRLLPLPEIERRVLPTMSGSQYLGVDLDIDSGIYTLKFLRNGLVIWVQVDGRSGQILGRSSR